MTETIMTKQYLSTEQKTLPTTIGEDEDEDVVEGESRPLQDVKVVSLEIDENDDHGSDPYNSTGSFAVPNFERS